MPEHIKIRVYAIVRCTFSHSFPFSLKGGIHFAPPTTISYIQVRPPVIDLYEVGLVTSIWYESTIRLDFTI